MSYIKSLKSKKMGRLNQQIFIIMIVTVTFPLLIISAVLYFTSANALKTQHASSSQLILTNLSFNIDQYLQSIENGTISVITDEAFQRALENLPNLTEKTEDELKIQYEKEIEDFVGTLEVSIKNIDSIQVFVQNRVFYSANFNRSDYIADNFMHSDWYKKTIAAKGKIVIFGTHKPFQRINATDSVISIARVINKAGSKQALSVMLIDIRLDSLQEILNKSETANRNFIILDRDDKLIYSTNRELTEQHIANITEPIKQADLSIHKDNSSYYATINSVNNYVNYVDSNYSGWKVIQYIPVNEITKYSKEIQLIILLLALMSLGTALLFFYILHGRVTKPIISLSQQVKQVGLGNFNIPFESNRSDEFGVLYKGIQSMMSDLKQHIQRLSDAKVQQKMTQYGALKSQINPHFLANTLETIQMKVIMNGDRETSELIGKLGQLFRGLIPSGKETLTLQEELQQLQLYIQIQQFRFPNRMQYEQQLADGSLHAQILHFILQPIVENAFVHGLERKVGTGYIRIETKIIDKLFYITVIDNGIGISEDKLQKLQMKLDAPGELTEQEHVGIKNVHDRLRFYYGEQYGLTIESAEGEGTKVMICLPYREQ